MNTVLYPSLTDRLRTQHSSIKKIIDGIDNSRLITRPQPGKWNIHDNIAHLARYQPVFIERINQILTTDSPAFGRYKAEDDPEFEKWRILDSSTLVTLLHDNREKINELLFHLNDDQLNRTGAHSKYGMLTIVQWTEFFLLHEAHHLFTIFQLVNDVDLK